MNLHKYETIILDCDGVIFDSNLLKLNAFRDALEDFDDKIVSDFIDYFKVSFGTSRYNLVKVFIDNFLKIEFDEELYKYILKRYSDNCILLYKKSNLTNKFLEFIEVYRHKQIYIASGSDQEELRIVFKQRDLSKYFINIYGSPKKKSDIVKDIVTDNKKTIMIGDAVSDMEAAKNSNIDFIFMKEYSTNDTMKKDSSLNSINNLGDLIE